MYHAAGDMGVGKFQGQESKNTCLRISCVCFGNIARAWYEYASFDSVLIGVYAGLSFGSLARPFVVCGATLPGAGPRILSLISPVFT